MASTVAAAAALCAEAAGINAGAALNHLSKPAGARPSTLQLQLSLHRKGCRWGAMTSEAAATATSRGVNAAPSHTLTTTRPRRLAAAATASSAAGTTTISTEVLSVEQVANKAYYNLTLSVPSDAISAVNYSNPGQYVSLKVSGSSYAADAYYVASAPSVLESSGSIEFLVHDGSSINTADALIASPAGTTVELTPSSSSGFNLEPLYPADNVQTVLLFASGYALGPVRALIETGFDATKRTEAKLYYFYASSDEMVYASKYEDWQKLGVTVVDLQQGTSIDLDLQDASQTGAVISVASSSYQTTIKSLLVNAGVSTDKIVTLF